MKDKTTAGILVILLGGLGFHKFYLGNSKGGVIYLLLYLCFGLSAILGLIDGIKYLMSSEEDFQAKVAAKQIFDFMS